MTAEAVKSLLHFKYQEVTMTSFSAP